MTLTYHKRFKKHFRQRIEPNTSLAGQFHDRLALFMDNPGSPMIKDHKLSGRYKEYRAFSVSGDVRVVYKWTEEGILLYDIGRHNQVY